jgi:hypothetical protein
MTQPAPYAAYDVPMAATMRYKDPHSSKNTSREYEYPVRVEDQTNAHQCNWEEDQQYFYRAMNREEMQGWQQVSQAPASKRIEVYRNLSGNALKINGHGGWASHRDYSLGYLSDKNTYLLEVFAPEFVKRMKEIGLKQGKIEDGDISWGVGLTSSNGFGPDKEANKTLGREAARVLPQPLPGSGIAKAKALAPYIFAESIQWLKVVNLRSVKESQS